MYSTLFQIQQMAAQTRKMRNWLSLNSLSSQNDILCPSQSTLLHLHLLYPSGLNSECVQPFKEFYSNRYYEILKYRHQNICRTTGVIKKGVVMSFMLHQRVIVFTQQSQSLGSTALTGISTWDERREEEERSVAYKMQTLFVGPVRDINCIYCIYYVEMILYWPW